VVFLGRPEKFSRQIIALVEEGKIKNKQELNKKKLFLCKKFFLKQVPSNPDILAFAENPSATTRRILGIKPTRTLSGIAIVALMPSPSKCPGKCIYCPNSLIKEKTPKSYTGREPATMRAVMSGFSAKKQILARLKSLEETGHNTGKIELVVMGGTFLASPLPKQKKFVLECLNTISGKKTVDGPHRTDRFQPSPLGWRFRKRAGAQPQRRLVRSGRQPLSSHP